MVSEIQEERERRQKIKEEKRRSKNPIRLSCMASDALMATRDGKDYPALPSVIRELEMRNYYVSVNKGRITKVSAGYGAAPPIGA